jgi:hypothetical protein
MNCPGSQSVFRQGRKGIQRLGWNIGVMFMQLFDDFKIVNQRAKLGSGTKLKFGTFVNVQRLTVIVRL